MMARPLDRLLHRRQFLIAPEPIEGLLDWRRVEIANTYHVAAHPDVDLCQVVDGHRSLTLIGFILDPDAPEHSNTDVLASLLARTSGARDVISATSRLGGRWALVVSDGNDVLVFGDAGGQRQIAYLRGEAPAKAGWCASHPGTIAERLALAEQAEAAAFLAGRDAWEYSIRWIPGDRTLYDQVRILLPNHYLDINAGVAHRFWPTSPLKPLSVDEALNESTMLLRGLVAAARHRFQMSLALTAGWDSRLMLALSRAFHRDLFHFTVRYANLDDRSPDITVPRALLKKLDVPYHVIAYPADVDAEFEAVVERSVAEISGDCRDLRAVYDDHPAERVCLSGDLAEVVKVFVPARAFDGRGTVAALLDVDGMTNDSFATAALEAWLADVPPALIDVGDLFAWELFCGRVQASHSLRYDIVQETFAPLNCHALLVTMLSTDVSVRVRPTCLLFRGLIERSWPELLSEPVNPAPPLRVDRAIIRTLVKLRIWQRIPRPLVRLGKRALGQHAAERSHVQ